MLKPECPPPRLGPGGQDPPGAVDWTTTDVWRDQMAVYWAAMKIFGMNPITVDNHMMQLGTEFGGIRKTHPLLYSCATGRAVLCGLWSWCTWYTAAFLSAASLFMYNVILTKLDYAPDGRVSQFDQMVMSKQSYLFFCMHLASIILLAESAAKMAAYRNQWSQLQAKYFRATGAVVKVRVRRLSCALLAVQVLVGAVLLVSQVAFEHVTAPGWQSTKSLPALVQTYLSQYYVLVSIVFPTGQWFFTTTALVQVARSLKGHLEDIVAGRRRGTITAVEELWLGLRDTACGAGTAYCYITGYLTILLFVSVEMSAYMSLSSFFEGQTLYTLYLVPFLYMLVRSLLFLPTQAHHVTEEIGAEFQQAVLRLRLQVRQEAAKAALDHLHGTIARNYPEISMGGYVVFNKGFGASILGTIITYLVIFIQFRTSSDVPSDGANSTNSTTEGVQ